jgi:Pyruvate/2-oxoacid:ferredoxin oxidoreductase delta subunit
MKGSEIMSLRKVINIDEEKCDGCGLCVPSCAEGAIQIIDGKARLVSETFCDGLGACLGECPQDAITIEEREADDFDEKAVEVHLNRLEGGRTEPAPGTSAGFSSTLAAVRARAVASAPTPAACPSAALKDFSHKSAPAVCPGSAMRQLPGPAETGDAPDQPAEPSQLGHWPVQLMLVPPHAPFLAGADLVICADCVPFTVPDFHRRYLAGRAVLVGCPKLDDLAHYQQKLRAIMEHARPRRVTVLKMEVPCCGGIAQAAVMARNAAAPGTPLEVHTIGIRGGILKETLPAHRVA